MRRNCDRLRLLHPSDAPASQVPEVIPGIELSTEYQGKDIHMVGLFIDYRQPEFAHYLEDFIRSRENRNEKMCALLREHDIDITYEALLAEFPGAVITRAHFARYLLSHGYIQSMKEAFDRYVGDHCPCFVPREKVTPAQAVELILGAGGVPVLAHPILYHMGDDRLDTLVAELKKIGLVGIEAIYSTYNTAEERQIRGLASKYDLKISGGSDFHGANKPKIDLGTGWGKLYVPDEVLENLRPERNKLKVTAEPRKVKKKQRWALAHRSLSLFLPMRRTPSCASIPRRWAQVTGASFSVPFFRLSVGTDDRSKLLCTLLPPQRGHR